MGAAFDTKHGINFNTNVGVTLTRNFISLETVGREAGKRCLLEKLLRIKEDAFCPKENGPNAVSTETFCKYIFR